MYKFLLSICLFVSVVMFGTLANAQHYMIYEIKGKPSIEKIIKNIEELFPGDTEQLVNGIQQIKKVDVEITTYMRPKLGYYKFEGRLCEQKRHVIGFYKSLEIWEKPNSIIVKSYIDIVPSCHNRFPFRWINRKRAKVICGMENMILMEECYAIQSLLKS